MAKILKFDLSGRKPETGKRQTGKGCDHKHVIAYTVYRTVRCVICGTELDPFDVLVDMLKSHVGTEADDHEEKRMGREIEKRRTSKKDSETSEES